MGDIFPTFLSELAVVTPNPRGTQSMSTKHTPGPWQAVNSGRHEWSHWINGPDGQSSVVGVTRLARDPTRSDANARLIAAAPDLLEALSSCVKWIESAASTLGEDAIVARLAQTAIDRATK